MAHFREPQEIKLDRPLGKFLSDKVEVISAKQALSDNFDNPE